MDFSGRIATAAPCGLADRTAAPDGFRIDSARTPKVQKIASGGVSPQRFAHKNAARFSRVAGTIATPVYSRVS